MPEKGPRITPGGSANRVVDKGSEAIAAMRNELERFKVETEHQVTELRSKIEQYVANIDRQLAGIRSELDDHQRRLAGKVVKKPA